MIQYTPKMQYTKEILQPICSSPKMRPAKDESQHKCITPWCSSPKKKRTRDAAYLPFTIPKIHNTKDATKKHHAKDAVRHQSITMPKMQCTKLSPHQKLQFTKDASRQRYNVPNMTKHLLVFTMLTRWPLGPGQRQGPKMPQKKQFFSSKVFVSIMCGHQ